MFAWIDALGDIMEVNKENWAQESLDVIVSGQPDYKSGSTFHKSICAIQVHHSCKCCLATHIFRVLYSLLNSSWGDSWWSIKLECLKKCRKHVWVEGGAHGLREVCMCVCVHTHMQAWNSLVL